jgi:hypothetical protein
MKIRVIFDLTLQQRRWIGQKMELPRLPSYTECKLFLEAQGMLGVEQAEVDYDPSLWVPQGRRTER